MEKDQHPPRYGTIPVQKWIDLKATGDTVVSDKELLCRNLTIDGDFLLVGNLFCNDIIINGNCIIYGSIFQCTNVSVTGNLHVFENPFIFNANSHTGGFFAPNGDVEIGEDLICDYGVRAPKSRFKVAGNVMAQIFDCREISIAGDCDIYPDTLWAREPVYVLGNITTGFPIESELVFCGGKYTKMFDPNRLTAHVYENFKNWASLKEELHE